MPATLTRTPAYTAASVDDLLGLWHGDDNSCGYWCPSLVTRVCELTLPADASVVRTRFYPGLSARECPSEAREMIRDGFAAWKKGQR